MNFAETADQSRQAMTASLNASHTSHDANLHPLVAAHSIAAAGHYDACVAASNIEVAVAHRLAAEAHETAAADQAAWIHNGDPDGAPGATARESARAWTKSAEAYELGEVGR